MGAQCSVLSVMDHGTFGIRNPTHPGDLGGGLFETMHPVRMHMHGQKWQRGISIRRHDGSARAASSTGGMSDALKGGLSALEGA